MSLDSHQLVNQLDLIGGLPADQHRIVCLEESNLKLAGIYTIRNTVNGKLYVGSTAWFRRRFKDHRKDFRQKKHHCIPLMRAWKKYGASAFVFEILEIVQDPTQEKLLGREQAYLDHYQPKWLYNICRIATSQLGMRRSEETKERMRRAARNRKRPAPFTEEHRQNLSKANKGKVRSAETCERMRQANLGKTLSPEHCQNMRAARLGKTFWRHTAESKRKLSIAKRGQHPTAESRAKMRAAKLGTKRSAESLRKQSLSLMGHKVSEETRLKLKAAALRREALKRTTRMNS